MITRYFVPLLAFLAAWSPAFAEKEKAATPIEADEPQPFDETANAVQDVDAALMAAKASGKNVIFALGGNWCHDSRGLAKKFETDPLKTLINDKFEVVWVDVGHRDRNLDIAQRFGVDKLLGTPTIIITAPDGAVLNAETVHDWRAADSKTLDEAYDYFASFAPETE